MAHRRRNGVGDNGRNRRLQAPLTYHDGHGWDGVEYHRIASAFAAGEKPAAQAPFVYRIAAPFLAARMNPGNLTAGFEAVNTLAAVLTAALFLVWLRIHLTDWRIRLAMLLLYLIPFYGPLRTLHWYPFASDSLTHLGIISGMLLLHYLERVPKAMAALWMAAFAAVAVTVREVMLLVPAAAFFQANPLLLDKMAPVPVSVRRWPSVMLFLPLLAGAVVLVAIRQWVVTIPGSYSTKSELFTMMYGKGLVPYLHGWLIAFGPALVLLLWKGTDSIAYLWERQAQLVFVAAIAVLGWIAGTDTERFLLWSFPVVYVLLGRILEANRWLFQKRLLMAALVAAQCLAHRVFWMLPDYPAGHGRPLVVFTMWGSRINYFDLWSWHAERRAAFLSFAEYIVAFTVFLIWLRWAESRRSAVSVPEMEAQAAGAAVGRMGQGLASTV